MIRKKYGYAKTGIRRAREPAAITCLFPAPERTPSDDSGWIVSNPHLTGLRKSSLSSRPPISEAVWRISCVISTNLSSPRQRVGTIHGGRAPGYFLEGALECRKAGKADRISNLGERDIGCFHKNFRISHSIDMEKLTQRNSNLGSKQPGKRSSLMQPTEARLSRLVGSCGWFATWLTTLRMRSQY